MHNFLYAQTLRGVGWESPPRGPHSNLPFILSLHTIIISILESLHIHVGIAYYS